jgi:AcrR family transcriptional regulator
MRHRTSYCLRDMENRIGHAEPGPLADVGAPTPPTVGDRVLDATQRCRDKWGIAKVTVEDIATESGVSRATIYRMFPGGRDVLFEALRVRELEEFFAVLRAQVDGADSLEELLVRTVVAATRELRADDQLALMLASEPGTVLGNLTVEGLPRIIRFATTLIAPLADPYLPRTESRGLIDVLARLTISYFLSPSEHVDLGDVASARAFLAPVLRAFQPAPQPTST